MARLSVVLENYLAREVVEKVVLVAVADSILYQQGLVEDEVMEIDRVVKAGIRGRIEHEASQSPGRR